MRKIILVSFVLSLFLSCKDKDQVVKVSPAFYFWKSNSGLGEAESTYLKNLNVHKLYVKMFEVDYNDVQGNFPYEKNKLNSYELQKMDSVKIVPTIFIRNGIFQFNDEKKLDKLADNIVFLIDKYHKDSYDEKEIIFDYDEIQIDCDWTKSTKDKYFYLLKKIKALSGKKLSCTLRLYPYKYPDIMGVPPVDRAMLMCYNLIKPLSESGKNSILDIEELKKYLDQKTKYQLPLDVALPVFYWSQLYQNNQFVSLLPLTTKQVQSFAKEVKPLWYEVQNDTTINYETYLKAGDQIKSEEIKIGQLQEAIAVIKEKVVFDGETTISLFDLKDGTFKQFSNEEISSIYSAFSK
ncbi:hypothetical protein FFWV33_18745 [Flavobacterium faecale]|uniref:GH18 domain-containing protein n=1 Tax=Flavobacterium faecale TaxID=1355330 RepID=A0A2S1LI44_9FLAO|nr:hypothetical protein [Flavobacterium faecale]AWG23423.1 hypothetical protein FFWV33_18745 [Flavobacterium faecale]